MIVTFQPYGKKQEAVSGDSLLKTAEKASILIDAACAGQGTCGKCKVRILSGNAGNPDSIEKQHLTENEIAQGWRLACRVKVTDDFTVLIPGVHGSTARKKDLIYLPEGFNADKRNFENEECYGIAFDIGTTTVVGMLWDLRNAKLVGTAARTNPQSTYGADVISRILFCSQKEGNLKLLQNKIIGCFGEILNEMRENTGVSPSSIIKAAIVGNTTMSHLLLNIDPSSLAKAPFTPNFEGQVTVKAHELGLCIKPDAYVHVLPNIAGHVGSDIVAVLLATCLKEMDGANLAIDIGTNGEILLSYQGKVLTCSTAAGPAFEGASIYQGMRAAGGAIEGVKIKDDTVILSVIDDTEPIGICGSGLIDCVAELLSCGIVSKNGRMLNYEDAKKAGLPEEIAVRLKKGENGNEFILYHSEGRGDIAVTQKDIREVQLAKGAIFAELQ